MKKLMTYGFYVLLLAVFAVNVDIITLSNDNNSSTTIELIDSLLDQEEAVASGGISMGPGYYWWTEWTINGTTYISCPPDGHTCVVW